MQAEDTGDAEIERKETAKRHATIVLKGLEDKYGAQDKAARPTVPDVLVFQ